MLSTTSYKYEVNHFRKILSTTVIFIICICKDFSCLNGCSDSESNTLPCYCTLILVNTFILEGRGEITGKSGNDVGYPCLVRSGDKHCQNDYPAT